MGSGEGQMLAMDFRMYDARLGRWWGQDPIVNPTRSPYIGMGDNSVNFADPLGLQEADPNADVNLSNPLAPASGSPQSEPPVGTTWTQTGELNGKMLKTTYRWGGKGRGREIIDQVEQTTTDIFRYFSNIPYHDRWYDNR